MIELSLRGMHTGDILMALPAVGGLLRRGERVAIICDAKYSRAINPNISGVSFLATGDHAVSPSYAGGVHQTDAWLKRFDVQPVRVPLANLGQFGAEQLLPGKGWCVLSPWAAHASKRWPVSRWTAIASRAARLGYRVAIVGPIEAHDIGQTVARDAVALNLVGKCTTLTWPALLERAHVVISPDTGAVHMADALNVPVIGLYGPTRITQFGPYWHRDHCVQGNSMESITADDVGEKLESIA